MIPLALASNSDAITALYIVAFSLFIYGLMQGTHPTTATAMPIAATRLPRRAVFGLVTWRRPRMNSTNATM